MTLLRRVTRITTKATFTPVNVSCILKQIVIACAAAGTAWTLQVQDKAASPNVLVAAFTLTVPADDKPIIIFFEQPIPMDAGIDIITAGTTAGQASVWLDYGQAA